MVDYKKKYLKYKKKYLNAKQRGGTEGGATQVDTENPQPPAKRPKVQYRGTGRQLSTANAIWATKREELWGENSPYSKVFKNLKTLVDKFYNPDSEVIKKIIDDSAEINEIIADTIEVFNRDILDDQHLLEALLGPLDTKAKEQLYIMEEKRIAARRVLYESRAAPEPAAPGDPPSNYGPHDSGQGAP